MSKPFPDSFDFGGYNAPSRIECDIYDLVVEGELPAEINGAWYRSVPDPQYAPMLGDDTFLSGDGMVTLLNFEDGHVDMKMRYVQTERFLNERKARRSLYGLYRNPYTDDESVQGKPGRSVSNTTPLLHGGHLLALKEDGRPTELHPQTLETVGEYDFGGELRSQTVTAHPRIDPDTGELFFYGYEAGGMATRDVAFCVADASGKLTREEWFQAPHVSMMHDFLVTKSHVLFPVVSTTADLDRIKGGGAHWVFEPGRNSYMGIMPRDGSVDQMRWFTTSKGLSAFHFMNAYSEGDRIHIDFGKSSMNPFPFIQKASGINVPPWEATGAYVRWSFDMSSPDDAYEERVISIGGDMPRIADKDAMKDYEIGYYQTYDPTAGPPLLVGPVGAGFNTILRLHVKTGELNRLPMPVGATVQEHIHIPSRKPGHEGYLAFVVDLHERWLSEIWVVEAGHLEAGPIARVQVPFRLRCQVHGSWAATPQPLAA
jgi:carotenoid cleavage dioxygenase-like enzyme